MGSFPGTAASRDPPHMARDGAQSARAQGQPSRSGRLTDVWTALLFSQVRRQRRGGHFVKGPAGAVHATLPALLPGPRGVKVTERPAARTARGNLRPIVAAATATATVGRAGRSSLEMASENSSSGRRPRTDFPAVTEGEGFTRWTELEGLEAACGSHTPANKWGLRSRPGLRAARGFSQAA